MRSARIVDRNSFSVDVELHGMLTSHLPPGAKRSEVTVFTDELAIKVPTAKPFVEDSA